MYDATVTVFNRYESDLGVMWYPSVFRNVNLLVDKASIVSRYGAESKDSAVLNVKVVLSDNSIPGTNGKIWLPPKEWSAQLNDEINKYITFSSGQAFDFFFLGEWDENTPVQDGDYGIRGFYDHMVNKYDYVFAITSVSGPFKTIPHFEITGR